MGDRGESELLLEQWFEEYMLSPLKWRVTSFCSVCTPLFCYY